MNIVSTKLSRRLAYSFCQHKMLSPFTIEAPIKHRVMATNQWPAPYYQRIFRSYPIRQQNDLSLLSAYNLDECTWINAKGDLQKTLHGRKVLDQAENRLKTNSTLKLTQLTCYTRKTLAV